MMAGSSKGNFRDETPMIKQYIKIKQQYKDTLLLYRVGDFYETFFDDAKKASNILNIALTSRGTDKNGNKIPLAGIPYHAIDQYLYKLIQHGEKVAICEQVEDPKLAKGVVQRDVIRIITPGTFFDEKLTDAKTNINIMSIYNDEQFFYYAYCDLSTGEFHFGEAKKDFQNRLILSIITMINPKELIVTEKEYGNYVENTSILNDVKRLLPEIIINYVNDWKAEKKYCEETIKNHFKINVLKGLGFEFENEIIASGMLLDYLLETQKNKLEHIKQISPTRKLDYMFLDLYTQLNLDLIPNANNKGANLFEIIDNTKTPMGGRLLKNRILRPLTNVNEIKKRLDFVEELTYINTSDIGRVLENIKDIERLISKIALKNIKPPQFLIILNALNNLEVIIEFTKQLKSAIPMDLTKRLISHENRLIEIRELIKNSISDNPPAVANEQGIFRNGYNEELDELRNLRNNGKTILNEHLEKIKEQIDVPIKLGYNKVFGYYFEISKTKLKDIKLPENLIRKQTLVASERFITTELKEIEDKLLNAEDRLLALERQLWNEFLEDFVPYFQDLEIFSQIIAEIDFFLSLKTAAQKGQYTRPHVDNTYKIRIINGRHPIIEQQDLNEPFVPNSTNIDFDSQIQIITGPNMSGKSTYLRQVALIVLMAQMGSFVPADESQIGVIDRIFTRIGASDNLALGQSTFMVEMNEVANILNSCTDRSLILLDEVGRGTSTYDGLAIAWAVVEYLHNKEGKQAKTLFATHYHELIKITSFLDRVKIFRVDVKEYGDKIIFLRNVVEGGTDKSYGIYVAKLAGIPDEVLKRAEEIMQTMVEGNKGKRLSPPKKQYYQPSLFSREITKKEENVLKKIKKIDINNIRPIDALKILNDIKEELEED